MRACPSIACDEAVAQEEGQRVLDGKVEGLAVALLQVRLALLIQLLLRQCPPCIQLCCLESTDFHHHAFLQIAYALRYDQNAGPGICIGASLACSSCCSKHLSSKSDSLTKSGHLYNIIPSPSHGMSWGRHRDLHVFIWRKVRVLGLPGLPHGVATWRGSACWAELCSSTH